MARWLASALSPHPARPSPVAHTQRKEFLIGSFKKIIFESLVSHWICPGPRNISKIIILARETIDYSRVPRTPTPWSQLHPRHGYKWFHREKVEFFSPKESILNGCWCVKTKSIHYRIWKKSFWNKSLANCHVWDCPAWTVALNVIILQVSCFLPKLISFLWSGNLCFFFSYAV